RDLQSKLKQKGLPWEKAKGFDGAAVVGKFFAKDNYKDLDNLHFRLEKNGDIVQQASTALMLWKIDELIAYVSQFFTLKIGDILFTGTPAGVGKVKANDVLQGFIEDKEAFKIAVK